MKVISWNINGIKTSLPFIGKLLVEEQPEALFLSEIKVGQKTLDKLDTSVIPEDYEAFWNPCLKGESHGTAFFVKKVLTPTLLTLTLPRPSGRRPLVGPELLCPLRDAVDETTIRLGHREEGRIIGVKITWRDEPFILIGTYVPNVGDPPAMLRLPYRVREWDPDLCSYLEGCLAECPNLIWCVYDPVKQKGKGCFTIKERGAFGAMCERLSLLDTFRVTHPTRRTFSFFSFRFASVATNRGWRLDYLMVSKPLHDRVLTSAVFDDIDSRLCSRKPDGSLKRISDHLPIVLKLK